MRSGIDSSCLPIGANHFGSPEPFDATDVGVIVANMSEDSAAWSESVQQTGWRGISPGLLAVGVTLPILFQLLPALLAGNAGVILRHGSIWVSIAIAAAIALPLVVISSRETLTIDRDGIELRQRRRTLFYNWRDVSAAQAEMSGKKASLVLSTPGRFPGSVHRTTLPTVSGMDVDTAVQAINDGVARYCASTTTRQTITPDDVPLRSRGLLLVGATAGVLLILVGSMLGPDYLTARDDTVLARTGIVTAARVIRTYADPCSKHGCGVSIDYAFVPRATFTGTVHGYAVLTYRSNRLEPAERLALDKGVVPVVYDPSDPRRSRLNLSGEVFRGVRSVGSGRPRAGC